MKTQNTPAPALHIITESDLRAAIAESYIQAERDALAIEESHTWGTLDSFDSLDFA